MTGADFANWMVYPTMAVTAILLARLLRIGGLRKYLFFGAFFLADILEVLGGWGAPPYSLRYGYAYFAGQGAKSFLGIAAAVELWLLALLHYPALARFGRKVGAYMLVGALLVAAAGLWLEPARSPDQSLFARYFNWAEGSLDSLTVLFLVAATLFLLWFPVRVARNTALLMGGLVVYLTAHWAGLLAVNLSPLRAPLPSAFMQSCDLLCLIFWAVSLKVLGETATTVTGHRWNQAEAEHLLGQLQAINTRLEEISR